LDITDLVVQSPCSFESFHRWITLQPVEKAKLEKCVRFRAFHTGTACRFSRRIDQFDGFRPGAVSIQQRTETCS